MEQRYVDREREYQVHATIPTHAFGLSSLYSYWLFVLFIIYYLFVCLPMSCNACIIVWHHADMT
jgi:hypothetical protein